MKNKILFVFKPHSIVQEITNSSSELFVGINANKEELEALIEHVHPNYLDEYYELKNIDELDVEELELYFGFATSPGMWPSTKEMYPVLPGFTFDELYEVDDDNTWGDRGEQYRLRNNKINPTEKWDRDFVTEENVDEIRNKLDPNREMHFLFSIDDNPDFDFQEQLEKFMIRYHLG